MILPDLVPYSEKAVKKTKFALYFISPA